MGCGYGDGSGMQPIKKGRYPLRRILIILTAYSTLTAACSLATLLPGNDESTEVTSEHRCGDGICDGPENEGRCSEDCSVEAAGSSNFSSPEMPAWFENTASCEDVRESSVLSEGSPWGFDAEGNTTELLEDGRITCVLRVQVCGDSIFKQQVIGEGEECPAGLHYSAAPPVDVCCDAWDAARQSGSPCDPLQDADCDGLANEADDYLLDAGR